MVFEALCCISEVIQYKATDRKYSSIVITEKYLFSFFQMFSAKEIELQVTEIEKEKEEAEKKKSKKTT